MILSAFQILKDRFKVQRLKLLLLKILEVIGPLLDHIIQRYDHGNRNLLGTEKHTHIFDIIP